MAGAERCGSRELREQDLWEQRVVGAKEAGADVVAEGMGADRGKWKQM